MKTALCTIAFREKSFESVLDLAVDAGCDGVEPWGKPDHLPDPYVHEIALARGEAVRSRGLVVSQFGSYANPVSPRFEAEMDEALMAAEAFSTDQVRVWAGTCGSSDAAESVWRQAIEGFGRFCERASDVGVTLAVEMHGDRLTDTVDGCLRLIEGVGHDNFRMNYQPLSSETPEEAVENARRIAPHVVTVHAQNYVQVGHNTRSLIGEGMIDYATIIQTIKQAGFDGFLEIEFVREENPKDALMADAAFLRSLCKNT